MYFITTQTWIKFHYIIVYTAFFVSIKYLKKNLPTPHFWTVVYK